MPEATYKVRSITWGDDADNFEEFKAYDDEDAAEMWCKQAQSNGNFSDDGYPDNHELEVTAPDGTVTLVEVDTDWEPQYYCRTRGPQ